MFSSGGFSARVKVVLCFPSGSTTWTAPGTTSRIELAVGLGSDGDPGSSGTTEYGWQETDVTYAHLRSDGSVVSWVNGTYSPVYDGSPTPDSYFDPTEDYCDPSTDPNCTIGSSVYSDSTRYHSFTSTSRTVGAYPASNGDDTTAFNKTFSGGAGGPASATQYTNIPVTPNQGYQIYVPYGGALTITFYK